MKRKMEMNVLVNDATKCDVDIDDKFAGADYEVKTKGGVSDIDTSGDNAKWSWWPTLIINVINKSLWTRT